MLVINNGRSMICTRAEVLELLKNMVSTIKSSIENNTERFSVEEHLSCLWGYVEFDKMTTPIGNIADVTMGHFFGAAYYTFYDTTRNNFFYTTEYKEEEDEYENLLNFMHTECKRPVADTYIINISDSHSGVVLDSSTYADKIRTKYRYNGTVSFRPESGIAEIEPLTLYNHIAVPEGIQEIISDLANSAEDNLEWEDDDMEYGSGEHHIIIAKEELEKNKFEIAQAITSYTSDSYGSSGYNFASAITGIEWAIKDASESVEIECVYTIRYDDGEEYTDFQFNINPREE